MRRISLTSYWIGCHCLNKESAFIPNQELLQLLEGEQRRLGHGKEVSQETDLPTGRLLCLVYFILNFCTVCADRFENGCTHFPYSDISHYYKDRLLGKFECFFYLRGKRIYRHAFLSLLSGSSFGPRPPSFHPEFRFTVEPADVVATKGRASAALHCSTGAAAAAVIRWRRNGEFLRFPDLNDRRRVRRRRGASFSCSLLFLFPVDWSLDRILWEGKSSLF